VTARYSHALNPLPAPSEAVQPERKFRLAAGCREGMSVSLRSYGKFPQS